MSDWVNILLSAVTSGGLAGAVVIWLSREWISARLKGSIQHEYNQQLELHKAQLKAEHEVALLNIKTALERQATLHAVAHASFAEGQKASMERRLSAVERLWAEVLRIRAALPSVVTFRDVMTADEYRTSKNHEHFRKLTGDITAQTTEAIKAISLNAAIEQVRPYVGEYMWAIFYGYHAILVRMLVILQLGSAEEWHQDKGTRSLIESVLTRTEWGPAHTRW